MSDDMHNYHTAFEFSGGPLVPLKPNLSHRRFEAYIIKKRHGNEWRSAFRQHRFELMQRYRPAKQVALVMITSVIS